MLKINNNWKLPVIVFLIVLDLLIIILGGNMKKVFVFLFAMVFMPVQILAYSNYIIPGGNTLGIELKSDGILVIGFYEINGKTNKNNLLVGDYIKKVNDIDVNTIEELTKAIEKNIEGVVEITYMRNNNEKKTELKLIYDDNVYKTGLYVKDKITGIGTLSYIDPETKIYGALGHEIIESSSKNIVEVKTGNIFRNSITSITKSFDGKPGSKNAKFYYDTMFGTITKNTIYGIYGEYTAQLPSKNLLEVGKKEDVMIGEAKIYTVLKNEEIKDYNIEITEINETSKTKNITFNITDKELLAKTGGVVQGMSGSPIIQNNKIIGVVTHVIIDKPQSGYGIFITTMLEEGEK